jgi:uncharacterized protein YcbK (DUF882 family)
MTILKKRSVAVAASVGMVLLAVSGSSWARTIRTGVHAGLRTSLKMKGHLAMPTPKMTGEEVVPGVMPDEATGGELAAAEMPEDGKPYELRMTNLHTGESLDVVYRIGDTYVPEALDKLNYFLRDHYTQDVIDYSPKEFDVLHAILSRLGRLNGVISIVCGYRTPETNAALRHNSPQTGVAEHSQHMEGHAIDIRVPGVSTVQLRNAALSLRAGGVGYYPVSQFVHVDVGPVREWSFGGAPRRPYRHHTHTSMGQ